MNNEVKYSEFIIEAHTLLKTQNNSQSRDFLWIDDAWFPHGLFYIWRLKRPFVLCISHSASIAMIHLIMQKNI